MKTLINKHNPSIRITAPEIVLSANKEQYWIAGIPQIPRTYLAKEWTLVEENSVDLEKEIDACWRNWLSPSNRNEVEEVLPKAEFAMHARHFYELGQCKSEHPIAANEEELKKAMKERYPMPENADALTRYRIMADIATLTIKPVTITWNCGLGSIIITTKKAQEILNEHPQTLEQAADVSANEVYPPMIEVYPRVPNSTCVEFKQEAIDHNAHNRMLHIEGFKAGAKWQQKQGAKGYVLESASPVCKEDKPQRLITILYDETEDNYVRRGDDIIIQIKKL